VVGQVNDQANCISSSVATGRAFYPEQVKGTKSDTLTLQFGVLVLEFKLHIVKFLNVEKLRTTRAGRKRRVKLGETKFYDGF
jgi:hypothetical protein